MGITDGFSDAELYAALLAFPDVKPETADYLLQQEVDGEAFLSFTETCLALNFSKLTYGQRRVLLQIVHQEKNQVIDTNGENLNSSASKSAQEENQATFSPGITENRAATETDDNDLGCKRLGGFINDNGVIQSLSEFEKQDTSPCLSHSFLNKRSFPDKGKSVNSIDESKKLKKSQESNILPMAIRPFLQLTEAGRQVIEFVEKHGFLDRKSQITLMRIIYSNFIQDKESPVKYYPSTAAKISIAKGIVTDFPQLADKVGDCPWMSWLKIVKTKFETVQAAIPSSKKKNKTPTSSKTKSALRTEPAKNSPTMPLTENPQETPQENTDAQRSLMKDLPPNSQNKSVISSTLTLTYSARRQWIKEAKPTFTDILEMYKHLASYQGAMISEEFGRLEPLHENFAEKFGKLSPYILKYAQVVKPAPYEEVIRKFGTGSGSALVLLPKLLNMVINRNSISPAHLEHIKLYKTSIESIPSSALVQIVPEGTDVESHDSLESSKNPAELSPIFPFSYGLQVTSRAGSFI